MNLNIFHLRNFLHVSFDTCCRRVGVKVRSRYSPETHSFLGIILSLQETQKVRQCVRFVPDQNSDQHGGLLRNYIARREPRETDNEAKMVFSKYHRVKLMHV